MFVSVPRYTEQEVRAAIAESRSYAEALRRVGLRPVGGNHRLFRKWVDEIWRIPTDHFHPHPIAAERLKREPVPLSDVLVEHSTYRRDKLKIRLFAEGLKKPVCELCGQGEIWRGRRMALILDHINGVPDDNRIENLRIVCPNCAATFDTHCGRKNRVPPTQRSCMKCGKSFVVKRADHRYCSRECGRRAPSKRGPDPRQWKVPHPPYEQLVRDIEELGYLGTGRRHGVSDSAIRKWIRSYARSNTETAYTRKLANEKTAGTDASAQAPR